MSITPSCTKACEAMPTCAVCGRRKQPVGRDSMQDDLCTWDCAGYTAEPRAGHLWPGELEREWQS